MDPSSICYGTKLEVNKLLKYIIKATILTDKFKRKIYFYRAHRDSNKYEKRLL